MSQLMSRVGLILISNLTSNYSLHVLTCHNILDVNPVILLRFDRNITDFNISDMFRRRHVMRFHSLINQWQVATTMYTLVCYVLHLNKCKQNLKFVFLSLRHFKFWVKTSKHTYRYSQNIWTDQILINTSPPFGFYGVCTNDKTLLNSREIKTDAITLTLICWLTDNSILHTRVNRRTH